MLVVLNDLALQYKFTDKFTAINKIKELVEVILKLKKSDANFRIASNYKIAGIELADDYFFPELFHEQPTVLSRSYRTAMLTFLMKCKKIATDESVVEYEGLHSQQCAYAYKNNGSLLSLQTKEDFLEGFIKCFYIENGEKSSDACKVEIRNLAVLEHIELHKHELPIRKYEPNPKHKKNYGWGSEMDLRDEIAQVVLNQAVAVDSDSRHLIAKYNGEYYSFRCHYDVCYHGYKDNSMPEHLKNKLDSLE